MTGDIAGSVLCVYMSFVKFLAKVRVPDTDPWRKCKLLTLHFRHVMWLHTYPFQSSMDLGYVCRHLLTSFNKHFGPLGKTKVKEWELQQISH